MNSITSNEHLLLDSRPGDDWGVVTGDIPNLIQKGDPRFWVVDNFYTDPDSVREFGLLQTYFPDEGSVGLRTRKQFLFDGLKERFEDIMQIKIAGHTADDKGWFDEGINGRFQSCTAGTKIVFHADAQHWAGIIFLTPDAYPHSGTGFYKHRETGIRHKTEIDRKTGFGTSMYDRRLHTDPSPYEKIENVANIYNRLILFDGGLLHSGENYFGWDIESSRFFQVFFFNEEGRI
jgi:hypothetical protein